MTYGNVGIVTYHDSTRSIFSNSFNQNIFSDSLASPSSFSNLNPPSSAPTFTSWPSINKNYLQTNKTRNKISLLVINFQSVLSKKNEFNGPIDSTKPDLIVGSKGTIKKNLFQLTFIESTEMTVLMGTGSPYRRKKSQTFLCY